MRPLIFGLLILFQTASSQGLDVVDLGNRFDHAGLNCPPGMFHHIASDYDVNSCNTSIRRVGREHMTWTKHALFEEALRIPMFVSRPGQQEGDVRTKTD